MRVTLMNERRGCLPRALRCARWSTAFVEYCWFFFLGGIDGFYHKHATDLAKLVLAEELKDTLQHRRHLTVPHDVPFPITPSADDALLL